MPPLGGPDGRGVSVIVPAYNEAEFLEATLDDLIGALSRLGRPFEVIVADDCSRDDTLAVAHAYAKRDARVKVATHVPNRGKGAAVRTGFAHATMPIVAYIDADIRPDAATLRAYVDTVDAGYGVALANKWDPASRVEYTFARRFASYGYAVFAKALFWVPVVDTQCGFKFFDRRVLEKAIPQVRVDRFGFDVELLAWCVHHGATIAALPIRIAEIRESRVNAVEVLKMFKDLLVARVHMWRARRRERAPRAPAVAPDANPEIK